MRRSTSWVISDRRVGLELRVQVPVVNVPFRLIYYYNPNGKFGFTEDLPGIFLPGKRNGFGLRLVERSRSSRVRKLTLPGY